MGQQDDVKCCYAHQSKIWVTDPDQTMWEIYVLHDDVPDWGEKDKKLKLLAPPFKALGLWGSIRRGWNNKFGRAATPADGAAAVAEHAEPAAGQANDREPATPRPRRSARARPARPAATGPGTGSACRFAGCIRWATTASASSASSTSPSFARCRTALVGPDHPWGNDGPQPRHRPVRVARQRDLFRSPRGPDQDALPMDDFVVTKTGQFLAYRVGLSAGPHEQPVGPRRRMPHGISYIHGASHYNSGQMVFTDFADALSHFADPRFRRELYRFVRAERREVLILFRSRDYRPRDYAYFVCALRTLFPWFCNANSPKGKVLWGNAAPYPAANLITGRWADDVYALKRPGGADAVARPPVEKGRYFRGDYGGGRRFPRWPEKALAWATYWRIRLRGGKGGMFFVNRETAYADHLERLKKVGVAEDPIARL